MKIRSTIILLLILTVACNRPLTEEQKNSDAVFFKIKKEYTLKADGSYTFKYYHKLLYNSYFAFHRLYGESFIVYNPEFQTLKVTKSTTKMRDGKVVKSPANAFNEVLPGSASDAPAYNHLREMVVTHVGLEIGAIVELEYQIDTKPGFMPFFADKINFFESSPIQDYEVIITVPENEQINFKWVNKPNDLDNAKRAAGDKKIYAWKAKNLIALSHEPMQTEGYADYPSLMFSSIDLETAFNFLKGKLTNSLVSDESSQKLINENLKGWEKVNFIKDFVVNNMNIYPIQPQQVGYKFRSPEQVWKGNGGTEGEKVILMAAMLKSAGFDAQPAFAGYSHFLDSKIGYPGVFDKLLVKVEYEGETRYISSVDDHVVYPGQRSAIGINDNFSTLNYDKPKADNNEFTLKANLTLSADGLIKGSGEITLNNFDKSKGLISFDPSSITTEKVAEKLDTIIYKYTINWPGIKTEKNENFYYFNLPTLSQGLSSLRFGELPTERLTTLDLTMITQEQYEYTITLPDGFKVISPVNETYAENSLGHFRLKTIMEENKVTLQKSVELNRSVIEPQNYSEFRQIMSLWLDKNLNRLVVKMEY